MRTERVGRAGVRITDLTVVQRILVGLLGLVIIVGLAVQAAVSSHPTVAYMELASGALVSLGFALRRRQQRNGTEPKG